MQISVGEPEDGTSEMPGQLLYQEAIGSLLFLSTRTRTDISAAVGINARRVAHPTYHD